MPTLEEIIKLINANDPEMTELNLPECFLGDKDIEILVNAVDENSYIRSIDLSGNNIVEGAKYLAELEGIFTLNLSDNPIDDEGVIALAANVQITNLGLAYIEIDADGIKALAANNTIKTLDLRGNLIKNEEALIFLSNASLENLDLSNNAIDADVLEHVLSSIEANRLNQDYQAVAVANAATQRQKAFDIAVARYINETLSENVQRGESEEPKSQRRRYSSDEASETLSEGGYDADSEDGPSSESLSEVDFVEQLDSKKLGVQK